MIGSFRLTQIGEFQPTRIGVFRPTQFGEFHPTRTFARNTLDCLKYIRKLKDKNIPVFFEKESINTMDAKGEV